jgi:hypothetical protein
VAANQLFTWSNGSLATYYELVVGTNGAGSVNLLDTGWTTNTSATVSIPSNGEAVYARLYQRIDGAWQHIDYTFTAP